MKKRQCVKTEQDTLPFDYNTNTCIFQELSAEFSITVKSPGIFHASDRENTQKARPVRCKTRLFVFFELNIAIVVHRTDHSERFEVNAHFAQLFAALLEAFFNDDSHAGHIGTGLFYDID